MSPITQEMFTWYFKEPDWKNKFLIGSAFALLTVIPIIGLIGYWIVFGYSLTLMRTVMRGETPTLSKWENYGERLVDGFKATLSAIAYYLPGVIFILLAFVVMFAAFIPIGLASPETKRSVLAFWSIIGGQLAFMAILGIAYLAWMIGMIPTPVAVGQYLRTGKISAGYHLRQVWQILRANAGGYLIAWVLYYALVMGLSMLFSFVYMTIILCCLLPFLMAPIHLYFQLMQAYLFGIAYREGCLKAGIALDTV